MHPPSFPESKSKEIVLYVETISSEACALIENLTKVDAARRLIGDLGFVDFDEIKEAIHALDKLSAKIQIQIRTEVLQPTPREISSVVIERLRAEITKQLIGEKIL